MVCIWYGMVWYRLLNLVSQKFCYVLLSYLRSTAQKVSTDPSSEFARRIAANRGDVYGEIRRRLALFHHPTSSPTPPPLSATPTPTSTTATTTTAAAETPATFSV
jgi:hypothetical protein